MDGVYSRPRPKRPYFEQPGEDIGRMHKRVQHPQPPSAGPGGTVFRILCLESKAGGVIGKGGSIVSQIRQEIGARVTVQATVQGCEERVIVISAPEDAGNNGGDLGKFGGPKRLCLGFIEEFLKILSMKMTPKILLLLWLGK